MGRSIGGIGVRCCGVASRLSKCNRCSCQVPINCIKRICFPVFSLLSPFVFWYLRHPRCDLSTRRSRIEFGAVRPLNQRIDLSRPRGFKLLDQGTVIQVESKNFRPGGGEYELRLGHADGREDRRSDEVMEVVYEGVEVGL